MKHRALGNTGLHVSEIGLGALEIGRNWAPDVNLDPGHLTRNEAAKMLNETLDAGVNFIDTAPAYWYSEEFIGYALNSRRDEFILATKTGEHCDPNGSVYDYSYEATLRFIENSLKRLQQIAEERQGNSCDPSAQEMESMITARNQTWAKKLPTLIETAPSFIAVGALHLPGEEGLINLLRAQGYQIEAVW